MSSYYFVSTMYNCDHDMARRLCIVISVQGSDCGVV
jgi:hypothetical protein